MGKLSDLRPQFLLEKDVHTMDDERTPLVATVYVAQRPRRTPHSTLRRFCTIALGVCLIIVAILFLIPVTLNPRDRDSPVSSEAWSHPCPPSWPESAGLNYAELVELLLETPKEDKAREWSEYYTAGPHLAGKNLSQALWTREKWEEWGVKTEIAAYDVYINYPLDHRLALLDGKKVKFEASLEEDIIPDDPTTSLVDRIPTFHGYSASGNVTAPYVFVNFGTFQDYEDLVAANVSLKGKIALAKYGRNFRGLKVKRAQELGMVGVVMYSDPQEDGEVTEENGFKTYPEGPARNPSSVQRGSTQYISASEQMSFLADLN
jgi:N-acetylated-alpha-linked acidic dipeptidase